MLYETCEISPFNLTSFAQVSADATRKEAELQRLVRAWEEFDEKARTVREWTSRAEALLADNRIDSKQAVDFHKRFFQEADERAVSELVRSGRELIEVRAICKIIITKDNKLITCLKSLFTTSHKRYQQRVISLN